MGLPDYETLNKAFNEVFFDGRFANRPVYIDLEKDVLVDVSSNLSSKGFDLDEEAVEVALGAAVYKKLSLHENNIYKNFNAYATIWLGKERKELPPFTALLVVLSLAAERMKTDDDTSSKNYYSRLADLLKSSDDEGFRSKLSSSGQYTSRFWDLLNKWLTDTNFQFGIPTARSFGSWKYVSFAMSQSLVRDGDREKLHKLFLSYGFSANETVGTSEMSHCLSQWLSDPRGHGWLAYLWLKMPSARERIIAAAIEELTIWDGSVKGVGSREAQAIGQRLYWVAYRTRESQLGGYKINFALATKNLECQGVEYNGSDNQIYSLKQVPGADFASIVAKSGKVSSSRLFANDIELVSSKDSSKLVHKSQPILILHKNEDAPYYQEVPRVTLHSPHLVVCYKAWEGKVSKYLEKYADNSYRKISPEKLFGIPDDWVLFQGVSIIRIDNTGGEVTDDLENLVPLIEGVSIDFQGGTKFNSHTWHGLQPPEIFSTSEKGMTECILEIGENKNIYKDGIVPKADLRNGFSEENKIFRIHAKSGKDAIDKILILRDSDTPDKRSREKTDSNLMYLNRKNEEGLYGFSAEQNSQNVPHLQGNVFTHASASDFESLMQYESSLIPNDISSEVNNHIEDDDVFSQELITDVDEAGFQECITAGYHPWTVDSFEEKRNARGDIYTFMQDNCSMTCSVCGTKILVSNFKRTKRRNASNRRRSAPASNVVKTNISFVGNNRQENEINANEIFDALCYLGSGGLGSIQSIMANYTEDPLDTHKILNGLTDLGHIDVNKSPRFGGLRKWMVSPPAAVETSAGYCYLSGFRNPAMINKLEKRLEQLGSALNKVNQPNAPDILSWPSSIDYCDLLDGITDSLGREIEFISNDVSSKIAAFSMDFNVINESLEQIAFGDKLLKYRFNLNKYRWEEFDGPYEPGAYKVLHHGNTYFYFDGDKCLLASHDVVKILAARSKGLFLHSYSPENKYFNSVLGVEPPGLLRRALVACSGRLPNRNGIYTQYDNVDAKTASLVFGKLYGSRKSKV